MTPYAEVSGLIDEIKSVFSEEISKGSRSSDAEGNILAAEFTTEGGKRIKFSTRRTPLSATTLTVLDANSGREELALLAERRMIGGGYMIDGQAAMARVPETIPNPVSTAKAIFRREIRQQRLRLTSRRA